MERSSPNGPRSKTWRASFPIFVIPRKRGKDLLKNAVTDPARLHYWMDIVLGDDSTRRAVIVIDQFEEIFTQLSPERENERVAFLNLLTYAATAPNGRTLILFTLRSDFVTNCASYPNLNALVNQQFIQVGAMTPDELVSAISRPAYQVGLRVDPALIAQIVNDVRGEPGALPLMQFALKDLFEAEKSKGELTLDGYTRPRRLAQGARTPRRRGICKTRRRGKTIGTHGV